MAALERREAARLVRESGGEYSPRVTRSTTLLVIGQDGWPLRKNGRLTQKLSRAKALNRDGVAVGVVSEDAFFARLGLAELEQHISRRYSAAQLSSTLGISGRLVRGWLRAGLIAPSESVAGVAQFDFRQIARARALSRLFDAGVSLKALRRSLAQLRRWMSGADELIDRMTRLESSARLAMRTASGDLVEPTGQLLLDFSAPDSCALDDASAFRIDDARHGDELFKQAIHHEEQGDFEAAVRAYRRLIGLEGPDPEVCFNLGNALYAAGDSTAALDYFREAVALDPNDAEAWNNLANMLAESGRLAESMSAFRNALAVDPRYADAHYGLADVLDELGRPQEARIHWQAYLKQDSHSDWAEYARSRLESEIA
jgi:Flp pilus assembly protein TadD/DNA-binding transcriptional MerR regulator